MKEDNQMQEQQNYQQSNQLPTDTSHGGHELFDAHEAISTLVSGLEQYMLYEQHTQDPQLQDISQRQQTFLKQLYNTLVETLSTGQDPSVKTQTYHMDQSNDVVYGMQPTQPTTPSQSVQEIDDQCVSSYMLEALKSTASAFTMTALEATNPVLRRVFSDSIPNIIEMAYEVFLYQNKHQYYQVPQLQQQDMQELANSFAPIQGGTMSH